MKCDIPPLVCYQLLGIANHFKKIILKYNFMIDKKSIATKNAWRYVCYWWLWTGWWLGAIRQQVIIWSNVDPDLLWNQTPSGTLVDFVMVSLHHNKWYNYSDAWTAVAAIVTYFQRTELFWENFETYLHFLSFLIIKMPIADCWIPSSWKTRTHLSVIQY